MMRLYTEYQDLTTLHMQQLGPSKKPIDSNPRSQLCERSKEAYKGDTKHEQKTVNHASARQHRSTCRRMHSSLK